MEWLTHSPFKPLGLQDPEARLHLKGHINAGYGVLLLTP